MTDKSKASESNAVKLQDKVREGFLNPDEANAASVGSADRARASALAMRLAIDEAEAAELGALQNRRDELTDQLVQAKADLKAKEAKAGKEADAEAVKEQEAALAEEDARLEADGPASGPRTHVWTDKNES